MNWYDSPYETVAQRKERAQRTLKRLQKKQPGLQPIAIEGKELAKTWWGKAWNGNLERYADFSSRIDRGRSYVKNGFVLDLQISRGSIDALVMGMAPMPYSVQIKIAALTKQKWKRIKQRSKDRIDSLQELMDGKFPRDLEEIFTAKGAGLFPSPGEIKFSCSCPDWAVMCKHVAAAFYGVGARLDHSPELFFSLRGVAVDDLISFAVKRRKRELLGPASRKKKSSRIIEADDPGLSALFNIDLTETSPVKKAPGKKTVKKTSGGRPAANKAARRKQGKK